MFLTSRRIVHAASTGAGSQQGGLDRLAVEVPPVRAARVRPGVHEAGHGVVVHRPHHAGPRLARVEHVEVEREAVAVEEDQVVGVDLADGAVQPPVEGADHLAGRVDRLVDRVVAGHPRVAAVAGGDRPPQAHGAVLEVRVLPQQRAVGGVVAVPVGVLVPGQGVQVDDGPQAVAGAQLDRPVEVAEAGLVDHEGRAVVLQVAVVDGQPDQVEPERGEPGGVLLVEERGQELLEQQLTALGAEHGRKGGPLRRLVGGESGDEVLHVHPPAEAHAPEHHRPPVAGHKARAVRGERRVRRHPVGHPPVRRHPTSRRRPGSGAGATWW